MRQFHRVQRYIAIINCSIYVAGYKRTDANYAAATRTDDLVRGVVRASRTWMTCPSYLEEVVMGILWLTGKKPRPKIGRNEHEHSVRFSQTRFLNLENFGDVGQHLGRKNR